jgi:hypothetical protein
LRQTEKLTASLQAYAIAHDGALPTPRTVHQILDSRAVSGFEAMNTFDALERSNRIKSKSKVVDLSPKLNREKWERDNRWTLSKQDLDLISHDISKGNRAATPTVQQAKGVAPKPPPDNVRGEGSHSRNANTYLRH